MEMTLTEKREMARGAVLGVLPELTNEDGDFTQIDRGAFVIPVEVMGEEVFVEVKVIVKGESFDLNDAEMAFAEKLAKAAEREAKKAEKAKARAEKEAAKAAKEAEKAAKA